MLKKKLSRSKLGRRSKAKGSNFEREVKNQLITLLGPMYPNLIVRRSLQAERAYESDVVVEGDGIPQRILDIWFECNHSNDPNPLLKLAQAVRDTDIASKHSGRRRMPAVVWRKTRSHTDNVTIYIGDLLRVAGCFSPSVSDSEATTRTIVTLDWMSFMNLLTGTMVDA